MADIHTKHVLGGVREIQYLWPLAAAVVTDCVDSLEIFVDIEDHPTPMIFSDKKRNADGRTKGKQLRDV